MRREPERQSGDAHILTGCEKGEGVTTMHVINHNSSFLWSSYTSENPAPD